MFKNAQDLAVIRSPAALRKHLVFIRAGAGQPWPFGSRFAGEERGFDIAVSYFDEPDFESKLYMCADFVLAGGLSKFHAAKKFFEAYPCLDRYGYVCFVDDDLEFEFSVDEFVAFCERETLSLAQPCLTADSFHTFRITLHHPGLLYRVTTYVETMCPVFEASHLASVIDVFDRSLSTYGLDVFWSRALRPDQRAAILDCFQMRHTRPITNEGKFYQYLASIGVNRWQELRDMMLWMGLKEYSIRVTAFITLDDVIAIT
jgi:hypothetical protein